VKAVPIKGYDRLLGPPGDWIQELDGDCGHLAIRDTMWDGHQALVSAWKPSPEDLQTLKNGGCITLYIIGQNSHPVVAVGTEFGASCIPKYNEPIDASFEFRMGFVLMLPVLCAGWRRRSACFC
jgi:hypothetical protein